MRCCDESDVKKKHPEAICLYDKDNVYYQLLKRLTEFLNASLKYAGKRHNENSKAHKVLKGKTGYLLMQRCLCVSADEGKVATITTIPASIASLVDCMKIVKDKISKDLTSVDRILKEKCEAN
ncbi:hypothetical protein EVAR_85439_1 [Eumeta japonica]|uniref:Uncharacterized protein n=1 Tax=Eumeta variegata TaxID=151549 RepID=A0A4C1WM85_EUMVA|nr:hypothetical protein EVAR_85439_1 [Eumeta japonica]